MEYVKKILTPKKILSPIRLGKISPFDILLEKPQSTL
jgi:hypothetical protein